MLFCKNPSITNGFTVGVGVGVLQVRLTHPSHSPRVSPSIPPPVFVD